MRLTRESIENTCLGLQMMASLCDHAAHINSKMAEELQQYAPVVSILQLGIASNGHSRSMATSVFMYKDTSGATDTSGFTHDLTNDVMHSGDVMHSDDVIRRIMSCIVGGADIFSGLISNPQRVAPTMSGNCSSIALCWSQGRHHDAAGPKDVTMMLLVPRTSP